jgi:hypothetical protein
VQHVETIDGCAIVALMLDDGYTKRRAHAVTVRDDGELWVYRLLSTDWCSDFDQISTDVHRAATMVNVLRFIAEDL